MSPGGVRALIVAAAVLIGYYATASPQAAGSFADRWAELAAAHDVKSCARCQPAAMSVADVVRRMRRQETPTAPAAARLVDVTAELRHVASVASADRARQAMRIADELVPTGARTAANFGAGLPPGAAQNAVLLVALSAWVRQDSRAALVWAQALPDETTRAAAFQEIARRLVSAGAPQAVALVSTLPAGPGRDEALGGVARQWAKLDRAAAIAWARGFEDIAARVRLLSVVDE